MTANLLSREVSDRICKHMNDDHKEALIAFVQHYGGQAHPSEAKMLVITAQSMEIAVDGEIIAIKFDHPLSDSEDAHRTLVSMFKSLPKG